MTPLEAPTVVTTYNMPSVLGWAKLLSYVFSFDFLLDISIIPYSPLLLNVGPRAGVVHHLSLLYSILLLPNLRVNDLVPLFTVYVCSRLSLMSTAYPEWKTICRMNENECNEHTWLLN